jgi:NADH:ubiquinone oxidoreductase subunit 5 (subunit L)/multisubunit Na+/H+ antiporter MnhA subunit
LRIDALSLTMMLIVTGVGSLIHLYSIGYMHEDERAPPSSRSSTCSASRCSCW